MKGRISVESELGHGATFAVSLPAQVGTETADPAQAEDSSQLRAVSPASAIDRDTILVIDDDPSVRDLMSRFLSKLDFNVAVASSGEEGLRCAKTLRPTMITLDVVMPGCDGWEVLHRLKADPQLSEVPVIMVTIVDNEAMALKLGATNYLVKPVDRERLAALIKKYISTESAPSSANRPASASARRKQAAANRS